MRTATRAIMTTDDAPPVPMHDDMTDAQYMLVSGLVKKLCGIDLSRGKKQLVTARLLKRMRTLGGMSFGRYIRFVRDDETGAELAAMLDILSTNQTKFHRHTDHFTHLQDEALPRLAGEADEQGRGLKIWSAGCSSGEEPYGIAMVMRECLTEEQVGSARILATDLSLRMLAKAHRGVYPPARVTDVPEPIREKYFDRQGSGEETRLRVRDEIRGMVSFARLNLVDDWPMRGPFDLIFCRNVMIYFDRDTQVRTVGRFHTLLKPGGLLYLGSAETLVAARDGFTKVGPVIFQKL
jgi:chemotaxis protein methyltransferase CheR